MCASALSSASGSARARLSSMNSVTRRSRAPGNPFIVSSSLSPFCRRLGGVPAASECLDEQDGGGHAPAEDLYGGDFVGQRDGLCGDDVEIAHGAGAVLVVPIARPR